MNQYKLILLVAAIAVTASSGLLPVAADSDRSNKCDCPVTPAPAKRCISQYLANPPITLVPGAAQVPLTFVPSTLAKTCPLMVPVLNDTAVPNVYQAIGFAQNGTFLIHGSIHACNTGGAPGVVWTSLKLNGVVSSVKYPYTVQPYSCTYFPPLGQTERVVGDVIGLVVGNPATLGTPGYSANIIICGDSHLVFELMTDRLV